MLHGNKGTGSYLTHSKERMLQEGDHLLMFVYGINILSLICQLKVELTIHGTTLVRTRWMQQLLVVAIHSRHTTRRD
jgi:hypothetical protein